MYSIKMNKKMILILDRFQIDQAILKSNYKTNNVIDQGSSLGLPFLQVLFPSLHI